MGSSLELFNDYFEQLDSVERTQVMKRALASYQELVNRVSDATTVMSEIPQTHAEVVCLHPPLITLRKVDTTPVPIARSHSLQHGRSLRKVKHCGQSGRSNACHGRRNYDWLRTLQKGISPLYRV